MSFDNLKIIFMKGGIAMMDMEQKVQEEEFDIEVQYCDPDDCLSDCLVEVNICTAVVTGWL